MKRLERVDQLTLKSDTFPSALHYGTVFKQRLKSSEGESTPRGALTPPSLSEGQALQKLMNNTTWQRENTEGKILKIIPQKSKLTSGPIENGAEM